MRRELTSIALAALLGAGGCAVTDTETAHERLCVDAEQIDRATTRELAELARGTPAASAASSAYAQSIAFATMFGLAAGSAVAGLVEGLATHPATQPSARDAAYGLGSIAIASAVVGIVLTRTRAAAASRARTALHREAERCP